MSEPLEILRELARENAAPRGTGHLSDLAIVSDDAAAHWAGVQVRQYVRHVFGARYGTDTPIYRRARRTLERMVKDGQAVRWAPGASALVSYWPVGLAATLRAERREEAMRTAPIGTRAPAINGGAWVRVENGWRWNPKSNGGTFPRPGGDWTGELIPPGEEGDGL